jgi:hypothetical protein
LVGVALGWSVVVFDGDTDGVGAMSESTQSQGSKRQQVAAAVFPYPQVPAPKWPEAPAESGYRPGITGKEYFEHLCKTEAGEFIYKSVENVEGIYQMRPREPVTDEMLMDRYFLEDPYGPVYGHEFTMGSAALKVGTIQDGFVNPRYTDFVKIGYDLYKPDHNYKFLEKPIPPGLQTEDRATYLRYTRPNTDAMIFEKGQYLYPRHHGPQLIEERVKDLKSRYGFTWRGIERPHDRELGIAGGELIVLDLQTNELLGVRRGFLLAAKVLDSPSGVFWLRSQSCPSNLYGADTKFLHAVLKPSKSL